MEYQEFLDTVLKEMRAVISADESVTIYSIIKNNGIRMKAMSIRRDQKEVCPIIYMAPFYRLYLSGRSLDTIVSELRNLYRMDGSGLSDHRIYFSFQLAKEKMAYRLINYESNRDFLRLVPHRRIRDFAVVYYLSLPGRNKTRGCAVIYNEHIKSWGVGEKDLYEAAYVNTPIILPACTDTLDQVLEGYLLPGDPRPEKSRQSVYVITNQFNLYGAAAVLYPEVLDELSGRLDADLYLLPSSVHEFLALPVSCGISESYLKTLVISINQTHLESDEILSDKIYRYDRKVREILPVLPGES